MAYIPDLIDTLSNSRVVIDAEHYQAHKGRFFETSNEQVLTGSNFTDYLLVTPATAGLHCHLVIEIETDAKSYFTLFEQPTTTTNGTAVSTFNNFRDSSSVAGLLVYVGPTVTATGTQIDRHMAGSGEKAGGQARAGDEWILKNNAKYLLRVAAGGTGATIQTHLHWYELVDGTP